MTLQTQDASKVVVLFTLGTTVDEVEGIFRARKKQMAQNRRVVVLVVQNKGIAGT